MDQLKELLKELTQDDQEQLFAYQNEVIQAGKDLQYHRGKVKYFEALIEQREGFIKKIEAKLKRIEKLEEKLSKTLD